MSIKLICSIVCMQLFSSNTEIKQKHVRVRILKQNSMYENIRVVEKQKAENQESLNTYTENTMCAYQVTVITKVQGLEFEHLA